MIYLCDVDLKNKILAYILLTTYLTVVIHQSIHQCHHQDIGEVSYPKTSHCHENFKEKHHDHVFHIGIFHFLGHLFLDIHHSDNLTDKHYIASLKTDVKKEKYGNVNVPSYFENIQLQTTEDEVKSLRAPPYLLSLKQQLTLFNTPLRAPPALV